MIAFDEAQEIRKVRGIALQPILAHAYDYLRNITMILTGSQVGLLYQFLQLDNPKAPLYGRPYLEIKLGHFSDEQAKEFLIKGFLQSKIKLSEEVLDYAIKKLNGVPGWLTYFGVEALRK
ncbi:MAG: ATP-binding protein [Euryarchaeota archaeon]|nr:ATP-binding protein [Euryarchaeota archaeon]